MLQVVQVSLLYITHEVHWLIRLQTVNSIFTDPPRHAWPLYVSASELMLGVEYKTITIVCFLARKKQGHIEVVHVLMEANAHINKRSKVVHRYCYEAHTLHTISPSLLLFLCLPSCLLTNSFCASGVHVWEKHVRVFSPSWKENFSCPICSLKLLSGLPISSGFTTLVTCHELSLSSKAEWEIGKKMKVVYGSRRG